MSLGSSCVPREQLSTHVHTYFMYPHVYCRKDEKEVSHIKINCTVSGFFNIMAISLSAVAMSGRLSACLPVHLSGHVCLYVCPSVCLSVWPCMSVCLPVCLSVGVCLHICLSVGVCLYVCTSVCCPLNSCAQSAYIVCLPVCLSCCLSRASMSRLCVYCPCVPVWRLQNNMYDVGGGQKFKSLDALVETYKQAPMVEASGSVVRLKQPVNATRFISGNIHERISDLMKIRSETYGKTGFWEEFEQLQQQECKNLHSRKEGSAAECRKKNRYKNILPCEC